MEANQKGFEIANSRLARGLKFESMSERSDLKVEIKKSVVVEPIKILIGSLLTLAGTLVLATIPQVRAHIWPAVPKWSLLVLSVVFLSVILALVPYAMHLRRRVRDIRAEANADIESIRTAWSADVSAVKTELETIKAKPNYLYKFGVKWDNQFNPLCPHCEAHLSNFQFIHLSQGNGLSRVLCAGCGRTVVLTDERGLPIRFADARARVPNGTAAEP